MMQDDSIVDVGGSNSMGFPNSWMIYFMDNPFNMHDLGGTPILGNLHIKLTKTCGGTVGGRNPAAPL